MALKLLRRPFNILAIRNGTFQFQHALSTSSIPCNALNYKMVVVGGGSGGCSMAAKFTRKYGPDSVVVIEPNDMHYYQPMWTLVGGGLKTLEQSGRPMKDVLPKNAKWIKDSAAEFNPKDSQVITSKGQKISYDYLIVATGLQLNYHSVKGLVEALETPEVCSNYSPVYVHKTYPAIKNFKGGNAIFTFPNTPVKCPGAPQKIMYLAEDYFRKHSKRNNANVMYVSSLPVIFGVKKYANSLMKIIEKRNINLTLRHNLIEVVAHKKLAIFENLDKPGEILKLDYELLHVTPPMGPLEALKKSPLADAGGWVDVNKETLQHVRYPNVFAIGDCTNLPTSRTAAGVAAQSGVLYRNLCNVIEAKPSSASYDGYTSCPLITRYGQCILAEFDYDGQPLETLPINQGKEMRLSYFMKKDLMPQLYWQLMLRGYWDGPKLIRKLAHLGMSR